MADILMENGDMVITDGKLSFVTGAVAIAQSIEMRLKTWLGETVYDQGAGVPYIQIIFQKSTPLESTEAIIEQHILNTEGVTAMLEFDVDVDPLTRTLTIDGKASTIDGDVDFSVSLAQTQEAA